MNFRVFNLLSKTTETRYVSRHETCASKSRLDASVCNDRQHQNSVINADINVKN